MTWDSTVYFPSFTKYFLLRQLERKKAQNLIGLAGLFFYTFICILLSKAPYKINWRPVLWGYFTQLVLGILVLRTTAGYIAFKEDFLIRKLFHDHDQGIKEDHTEWPSNLSLTAHFWIGIFWLVQNVSKSDQYEILSKWLGDQVALFLSFTDRIVLKNHMTFKLNRSFEVFGNRIFHFPSILTKFWHLNLIPVCQKFSKNSNFLFFHHWKCLRRKFRNYIITGNWVILTYKSAIHGKGSFSQIIFFVSWILFAGKTWYTFPVTPKNNFIEKRPWFWNI